MLRQRAHRENGENILEKTKKSKKKLFYCLWKREGNAFFSQIIFTLFREKYKKILLGCVWFFKNLKENTKEVK